MKARKLFLFLCISGMLLFPAKLIMASKIEALPPCLTISMTGTNVTCYGLSNGSAALQIYGGSGNFTITWSTGQTGIQNLSNLPAGFYNVKVVDNVYGCTAFDIINITEPNLLTTSKTSQNINCFGESTGSINLTIAGGTQPYNTTWSNSATDPFVSNLSAGVYTVNVIDLNGCQVRDTVILTQPAQALGSNYLQQNILCHGDSNGSIDLSVWGGTPPYSYNWNSNTYNSQDLNMIPVGVYNILTTDIKGCQSSHSIGITGPNILAMGGTNINNNCFGETNGSIQVTVTGGTLPYSYSWANSDLMLSYDTPEISNLANTTYSVTVTDHNGCSLNSSYQISSPPQITYTISGTDVTSLGGADGQIYFSVSGGVSPYSYNWSNGITTANNLDVSSNIYDVTVLDMNNCVLHASIQIKEPLEALSFTYTSKNNTCHGSTDGEIFAYATGGTPPYRYQWSTGDSLSYITGLSSGSYILTLRDFNNVIFSDTVEIAQPQAFMFSHTLTEPSCYQFNNGSIDLSVSGGTAPYRYYWYDPQFALAGFTQDLNSISAGQYTVEIIDTIGCMSSYSVILDQPVGINLAIAGSNIQCTGGTSGSLTTSVSGGILPYSYLWSSGQTTPNINSIPAGNYTVTVSDFNGCIVSTSASIMEPDSINIKLKPYETSCIDQIDGMVTSTITGGSGGYNYLWSSGETSEDISDLRAGYYTLSVTDIFGCETSESTTVTSNNIACLTVPNTFSPNGDGINDTWVINNIELYPDCYMQIFNKWGTIVFESQPYSESWDGTYQGNPLPAETYYYILSFDKSLKTLTGTITIIK